MQAHTWVQIPLYTHLPEWVPLFRKNLKVLVCKLQGWESVEFQVCPRPKEGGQVDKCVKTQSIIAIVGQVGHEYTDLGWRNRDRVLGQRGKGKGLVRRKYIVIVLCKIMMKSKSHFPSSHICNKKKCSKYNYCCDCSGKQTDYFLLCDGFKFSN